MYVQTTRVNRKADVIRNKNTRITGIMTTMTTTMTIVATVVADVDIAAARALAIDAGRAASHVTRNRDRAERAPSRVIGRVARIRAIAAVDAVAHVTASRTSRRATSARDHVTVARARPVRAAATSCRDAAIANSRRMRGHVTRIQVHCACSDKP